MKNLAVRKIPVAEKGVEKVVTGRKIVTTRKRGKKITKHEVTMKALSCNCLSYWINFDGPNS